MALTMKTEAISTPRQRSETHRPAADWALTLGANPTHDGVLFRVWAPVAQCVEVVLRDSATDVVHALQREEQGYWSGHVDGVRAGARYKLSIDGELYPDPVSRSQPDGVHGDTEVVDRNDFIWSDLSWSGIAADDLIIYELHVGTFTPEGTFDGAIAKLDYLAQLGVTAIEVMPVASFPGSRNWGYDGVSPFAVAACYGGPYAFKRFVAAAHKRGLAVLLDVVYNHFGPDGNYLPVITGGRFFTDRHSTPWGNAVNYDGPDSEPVRDFVLQNALFWAHEYHVDGLRLDATHAIVDESPVHIVREIAERLHALTPRRVVIAEDDRNDRRLLLPPAEGGLGLDAVWADDFHHQARRLTAGDSEGYFASYNGTVRDLAETLRNGWWYEGQWSEYHRRQRGTPASGLPSAAFVHCLQNHDQVGNRPLGDRLNAAVPLPVYRALSAVLLLSPYTPLLWMGQEWAASTPFQYFTDHPNELGQLVTDGRRNEFRHFSAFADPSARSEIPDPQAATTFLASRLRWSEVDREPHRGMLVLYRSLLALRRTLGGNRRHRFSVAVVDGLLVMRRASGSEDLLVVASLSDGRCSVRADHPFFRLPASRRWEFVLATEDERFGGHLLARPEAASLSGAIGGPGAIVFLSTSG